MNDLMRAWARNRFKQSHSASGDDEAHWCRFLQRNQGQVSTLDWTAYRILNEDESAWQIATVDARRDTLRSIWNQVHQFEDLFFELSSLDKRRSYEALQEYLTHNPPALMRISRYEPFLDLDSAATEPAITDELQLVVLLAKISVSSPIRREEVLARTLDKISDEPLRWRRAAMAVLKQPKFARIEPSVIKHVVSMLPYEDLHVERQKARRRKFRLRYGWKIVAHRATNASLSIPWIAVAVIFAALAFVFVEGRRFLPPDRRDEELKKEKMLSDIMAEFESRSAKVSINPEPGDLQPNNLKPNNLKTSDLESRTSSSTKADRVPDRTTQARWREVAMVEGNEGLDNIQKELEQELSLIIQGGFQSAIDDQRSYLRQFDSWRRLIGNGLAAKHSSEKGR